MKRSLFFLLALLVFASCSEEEPEITLEEESPETTARTTGEFITFSNQVGKITDDDITVPISSRGVLRGGAKEYPIYLTGAGIRRKKVVIVTVNVYAAAHYVSTPKTSTADGVFRSQAKVMRFTMLRDVSADQLRDAFIESMKVNGVDIQNDPFWSQLFARLDVSVAAGQVITFAGVTDDQGMDHLIISGPKTVTAKGVGIVNTFWRQWFGIAADDGIAELKPQLLSYR